MAKREYPTAEYIRQIIKYNSADGSFTWLARNESQFTSGKRAAAINCAIWNSKHAGKKAGGVSKDGYYKIRIDDWLYLGHRIAWIYYHGSPADGDIDHINMDVSDNRIANLRAASRSQNMANTKAHKDSQTGVKGVYLDKRRCTYNARICVNGSTISLGAFRDLSDAIKAYEVASIKYFGDYHRN